MKSNKKNMHVNFNEEVPQLKPKSFLTLKTAKNLNEDHLRILISLVAIFYDFLDDPSLPDKILEQNEGVNDNVFHSYYSNNVQMFKTIERASRILEEDGIKPENVNWARNLLAQVSKDAFQASNPITEAVNNIYNYVVAFVIYYQNNFDIITNKKFYMSKTGRSKNHGKKARSNSRIISSKFLQAEDTDPKFSCEPIATTKTQRSNKNIASEYSRPIDSKEFKKKLGLISSTTKKNVDHNNFKETSIKDLKRSNSRPFSVNYNFPELIPSDIVEDSNLKSIVLEAPSNEQEINIDNSTKPMLINCDEENSKKILLFCNKNDSMLEKSSLSSNLKEFPLIVEEVNNTENQPQISNSIHSVYNELPKMSEENFILNHNENVNNSDKNLKLLSQIPNNSSSIISQSKQKEESADFGLKAYEKKFQNMEISNYGQNINDKNSSEIKNSVNINTKKREYNSLKSIPCSQENIKNNSNFKTATKNLVPLISLSQPVVYSQTTVPSSKIWESRSKMPITATKKFQNPSTPYKNQKIISVSKSVDSKTFKESNSFKSEIKNPHTKGNFQFNYKMTVVKPYVSLFSKRRASESTPKAFTAEVKSQIEEKELIKLPKALQKDATPEKNIHYIKENGFSTAEDGKVEQINKKLITSNQRPIIETTEPNNQNKSVKKWLETRKSNSVGKTSQKKSSVEENINNSINLHAKSVIKEYIENPNIRHKYFNEQHEEQIQKKEVNKLKIEMNHYKFLVEREASNHIKEEFREKLKVNDYYKDFMEKYKNYTQEKLKEDKEYYNKIKNQTIVKNEIGKNHKNNPDNFDSNVDKTLLNSSVNTDQEIDVLKKSSVFRESNYLKNKTDEEVYKSYIELKKNVQLHELEEKKLQLKQEVDYFKNLLYKN